MEQGTMAGSSSSPSGTRRSFFGWVTAGAAALIAVGLAPAARDYLIASHRSVERGHEAALARLQLTPLLDLQLRLGEGTGACLGISLLQAAIKVYLQMATFDEAGVSDAEDRSGRC